jgi:predicted AAA+ superfamily ATPase
VKFKYVGSVSSEEARKIMDLVNDRKNYKLKLKQVKDDLKEIGKIIRGWTWTLEQKPTVLM